MSCDKPNNSEPVEISNQQSQLAAGKSPAYPDGTQLLEAVKQADVATVKELIAAGADVNIQDAQGLSAVMMAIEKGNIEIVKLLLLAEASVPHEQAIALAEKQEKELRDKLVSLLRYNEWNVPIRIEREGVFASGEEAKAYWVACANGPDLIGWTPLHWAIKLDDAEEAESLISEGADVNFVNQFQESTLMFAVKKNRVNIINLLIQAGADIDYKNSFGKGALQLAQEKGYTEAVELLKAAGAKE